jgi:hypothetical protein
VPWKDTTHIQVGENLFISPAEAFQVEVEFKNFSTHFVYQPLNITVDDIVVAFDNYTRRYNQSLNELLESMPLNKLPDKGSFVMIAIVALCFILSCTAATTSYFVYRNWRRSSRPPVTINITDPDCTASPDSLLAESKSI